MSHFALRRDRVRQFLKKKRLDAILVTNVLNVSYLTGFGGDSSFLLLERERDTLFSDGRYTTQIEEECPGLPFHIRGNSEPMPVAVRKSVGARPLKIAFEADSVPVSLWEKFAVELDRQTLVGLEGTIETFRQIKDKTEIAAIRRAVVAARTAFDQLLACIHGDRTEAELRNELEYRMRLAGAETVAFPSIVAAGPRAALPHAIPTNDRLGNAMLLLIDWGAQRERYVSDMTRTLFLARPSAKMRKAYNAVERAQAAAIAAIRPGVTGEAVDRAARSVIEAAGFGKRFTHGTGHGIGLEVHESPRLTVGSAEVLKPGMVVTVEPGIYLPGVGGVRIEDDVLVTKNGAEILTRS